MKSSLYVVLYCAITLLLAKQVSGAGTSPAPIPFAASDQFVVPGSGVWIDVVSGVPHELAQVMDLGPVTFSNPVAFRILEPGGSTRPTYGTIGMSNGVILKGGEVLQAASIGSAGKDLFAFWSARLVR
jgi:hypothetical protein